MKTEEKLAELLREHNLNMCSAESCTGGRIANIITSMAGSSEYFKGSVVAYCNTVKHNVLGVSSEDLGKYGAVSKPVVEQMATGACRVLDCECAVATSGIAGPGGGSAEKPVGTVWIAAAFKSKVVSECFHFEHDRAGNIEASANTALRMLCELVAKEIEGE